MASGLIRYDLSLPNYFSYPPAPHVATRTMIPRGERRALYMRGEYATKADGKVRPVVAHNTTHLDVPYHFLEYGDDLAAVLNRAEWPADRPCLARVVHLAGDGAAPGAHTRDGIAYRERVDAAALPPLETLRGYEALVVLTGFGAVMARQPEGPFAPDADGLYHLPHLAPDAVERIVAAGIRLVALDSNTVEAQTGADPVRFTSDAHFALLGHEPPVLIVEGLGGAGLAERVGFAPAEALLHVVPKRAAAAGAEAAHTRAFLYFYRDDPQGRRLRELAETLRAEELYG